MTSLLPARSKTETEKPRYFELHCLGQLESAQAFFFRQSSLILFFLRSIRAAIFCTVNTGSTLGKTGL